MEVKLKEQNTALKKYDLSPESVSEMVKEYHELAVVEGDIKSYKTVRAACTKLVHVRTAVDKRRKDLGEAARQEIKDINSAAKMLLEPLVPLEERFKAEMKAEDDRKAAIKEEKERLERERIQAIQEKITHIRTQAINANGRPSDEIAKILDHLVNLEITEEEYQEFRESAITAADETYDAVNKALKDRQAWEKEEAERKAEAERLEKQKLEQEEAQRKIDEENRKIQEEKDRIEAEKKAEQERREREQWEREAKLKAEAEAEQRAKEKAEREQWEREAKLKAEEEERKRQELLKPDKEKLLELGTSLAAFPMPTLKDKKAKAILNDVKDGIEHIVDMIQTEVGEL